MPTCRLPVAHSLRSPLSKEMEIAAPSNVAGKSSIRRSDRGSQDHGCALGESSRAQKTGDILEEMMRPACKEKTLRRIRSQPAEDPD